MESVKFHNEWRNEGLWFNVRYARVLKILLFSRCRFFDRFVYRVVICLIFCQWKYRFVFVHVAHVIYVIYVKKRNSTGHISTVVESSIMIIIHIIIRPITRTRKSVSSWYFPHFPYRGHLSPESDNIVELLTRENNNHDCALKRCEISIERYCYNDKLIGYSLGVHYFSF